MSSQEQRYRELLEATLDLLARYAGHGPVVFLEDLRVHPNGPESHTVGYKGLAELIALELDADWEFGGDDE